MEELEYQERPGLFTRIGGLFKREEVFEDGYEETPTPRLKIHTQARYQITIRRQITTFQDAVAAADGLKRGEQQILNLTGADAKLREKIKDFMCGVNYAEEGTWEELGEDIFLLAPPQAQIEVVPPTPRMAAQRN